MTTTVERARWYPSPPPALDGEDHSAYIGRLTGTDGPYDHRRDRECSIGRHKECPSWHDDDVSSCECPCHSDRFQIAKADLREWLFDGAAWFGGMYGLPRATGLRVMALAGKAADGGPDVSREALLAALCAAYGCQQSDGFLADVANVYHTAVTGTLR